MVTSRTSTTLADGATAYGMEVSKENSKIMTNSMNISADISMNGQKLEGVTSFRELGAALCKDGICSAEIRIRIASTMAALTVKAASVGLTPGRGRARDYCQFFRGIKACADSSASIPSSCAQHAVRSLHTFHIPPLKKKGLVADDAQTYRLHTKVVVV